VGQENAFNGLKYSTKIVYDNEHLGTVNLMLDDSKLNHELKQTLINSVFLVLFTVLIIGAMVLFFFRSRVLQAINLAQTEKEFFSIIMNSASSLVIVLEENGKIVLANNACERYLPDSSCSTKGKYLWDYFSIQCEGVPLQDVLNRRSKPMHIKDILGLKANNCISTCEIDHEKTIIEWSFDILQDDVAANTRLIATGVDETLQYLECEKLSYLALHDSLTGLPNRSLFIDHLESALAQYERNDNAFCLLYLDLDKFKPINDNFGHEAGDFVLKAIADILKINLRAVDTVARLGGDEFGIILTNIQTRDDAAIVAQKCINEISRPLQYSTHQLQLGVSIGIAFYPDHKCELAQLINYADTAMYEVKQSGRNAYSFYQHNVSVSDKKAGNRNLF
jgi:diguanylate cyclase (GGDEF)-like protein